MNWKVISLAWSYRKELKAVILAFLIVLSTPFIAIILLTQLGINVISDQLVDQDPVSQEIQIKNPVSGEVITQISPTVVWPTKGVVTLEFAQSSLYQVFHTGIDIAGNLDDPVNPAMDGTVVYAGEIFWGYGKHIIIDHGNNITTIYAHLNHIYVYTGQEVTTDQVVGGQGSSGWSTGVHLHFQVNVYDIPVNPRVFLGK
jgi:murein DD-endopeptidase MepM/ murein hydrolase activator NlpD